ncbi:hypothetical protein CEXT_596121 [Caerostris extrusa]|uniref:Uncharacterized protein n=1 Tax=Caerostris extrusa TaxID=172846 RepID=A0AAV4SIU3_CAEEX|nr:hypothetical protein CEXT_596121 [Caerostris extrusa]
MLFHLSNGQSKIEANVCCAATDLQQNSNHHQHQTCRMDSNNGYLDWPAIVQCMDEDNPTTGYDVADISFLLEIFQENNFI